MIHKQGLKIESEGEIKSTLKAYSSAPFAALGYKRKATRKSACSSFVQGTARVSLLLGAEAKLLELLSILLLLLL